MPELPEVETVMRGLQAALLNKRVATITATRKNLRIPFPKNLRDIEGKTITAFHRRAKYILITFSNNMVMIVHLGMSGRMTISPAAPEKHDHMIIDMDDKTRVVFNDARRFGLVDLVPAKDISTHRFFAHLGPEPLEKEFSAAYLHNKLKDKTVAIKLAIMDQAVVVGVGNIYASEALYDAGIDPRRSACDLTADDLKRLAASIRKILKNAIKAGGSSLRDYVQADGELGYFQHQWAVYGKEGTCCPACKKPCITCITQGGRSTFYCPKRQT